MATILVGGILLFIVVAIIGNMVRKRKQGKSVLGCGCGCDGCSSEGNCHPKSL